MVANSANSHAEGESWRLRRWCN